MFAGSLGTVVFQVSPIQMLTFRDLTRKRSVQCAEHDVLQGLPRLQHTGRSLDEVTLTVVLNRMFSFDQGPDVGISALLDMANCGNEVPLVLGPRYHGLWCIKSMEVSHKIIHMGLTWRADVSLTLTEYN